MAAFLLVLGCTAGGVALNLDTSVDDLPVHDTEASPADSSRPGGGDSTPGNKDDSEGFDDSASSVDSGDSARLPESTLGDYGPSSEAASTDAFSSNLSGVTWNEVRGTYMVARDSSARLHEFDDAFVEVREIGLQNLAHTDTEDIVWLGSSGFHSTYALVTETGVLYIGSVPDESEALDMEDFQVVTYAPEPLERNNGGEGVAYDPETETFWVCTEKDPMKIYEFARPESPEDVSFEDGLVVSEPFSAEERLGSVIGDISSCGFDSGTGRLLILSHESAVLLDVDLTGTIIDSLDIDIDAGDGNKAEGFAFDDQERLLVVGEPNSYRFYESAGL